MLESKSRFAKRIGRSTGYVYNQIKRGNIILNPRGYVRVEESKENLAKIKRGRPKIPPKERIIYPRVRIKRRQKKVLSEIIKQLR
jgi:hypothetical protein